MQSHGEPAPGWTLVLRRQPVRLVEGRPEGGYTDAYELICCDCGDKPDLDYRDISPDFQRIRGRTGFRQASRHTGSTTASTRAAANSRGRRDAEANRIRRWQDGIAPAPPAPVSNEICDSAAARHSPTTVNRSMVLRFPNREPCFVPGLRRATQPQITESPTGG